MPGDAEPVKSTLDYSAMPGDAEPVKSTPDHVAMPGDAEPEQDNQRGGPVSGKVGLLVVGLCQARSDCCWLVCVRQRGSAGRLERGFTPLS